MTRQVVTEEVSTESAAGHAHLRRVRAEGTPRAAVLFVHGNCSSSAFWDPVLRGLPSDVAGVAVDLRGFGAAGDVPVDATRGMRDFADDLLHLDYRLAFAQDPNWVGVPHIAVGHSAGAAVVLQAAIDHPRLFEGIVLEAPMSPFGFGGTRDLAGTPTAPDFAGSGGGTANAQFVAALAAGDRSDAPGSPRDVLRQFYVADPASLGEDEEALLDSVLSTRTGDDFYPGDATASEHWPFVAPGTRGMNNAISPKYCDVSAFAASGATAPVLWVRGEVDAIVSDASSLDLAQLGALGVVPGWPGAEACPPQPMVAQTRAMLDAYAAAGGAYREVAMPGVGHSPHLESPHMFLDLLADLIDQVVGRLPGPHHGKEAVA